MNKNTKAVMVTLSTNALPASWKDLLKELGCRKGNCHTEDFPIWWRIDGKGYTLWLSEIRLADSTATPPTWHFKLETLAALPPAGIEKWDVIYAATVQFLEEMNVTYAIT